jgi:hypothetical protein
MMVGNESPAGLRSTTLVGLDRPPFELGTFPYVCRADAVDPERVNPFEFWRDKPTLDAWRKVAKGPRGTKVREAHVNLDRTDKAEKPFLKASLGVEA